MFRVLVAELKQETATFNPVPTHYDDFRVYRNAEIIHAYAGTKTEVAGALEVFAKHDVEVVPTLAADAVSGGRMASADLRRLLEEMIAASRQHADVDGVYLCLHGAMAGADEDDPEGKLLADFRTLFGGKPIVASLDLHAVLTDRMLDAADMLVPFHTYPHIDQYETGVRTANNLLRLLRGEVRPTTARFSLPMLVRGDELITATGTLRRGHSCLPGDRAILGRPDGRGHHRQRLHRCTRPAIPRHRNHGRQSRPRSDRMREDRAASCGITASCFRRN